MFFKFWLVSLSLVGSFKGCQALSAIFLGVCFVWLNKEESTCETRKNVFYFTSKALFVDS